MENKGQVNKKALLIKLAVAGLVVLAGCALLLRGVNVRELIGQTMDLVRASGPWAFFAAMALLPAAGFPLIAFSLSAGPAFGQQLGIGVVLLGSAIAILVNICLTYWLARYALRPLLERLVAKLGYKIPKVEEPDQLELAILLRITPGAPFFVQSYLLGLAQIPFRKYIVPSFLAPMLNTAGLVIFGDAIAKGKAKWAIAGICLVVAAALLVQVLRRHYAKSRKRREAIAESPLPPA